MRVRGAVVVVVLTATLALAAVWVSSSRPDPPIDVVALNDLTERVATDWPSPDADTVNAPDAVVAVVDKAGRLRYRQGDAPITDLDAAHTGAAVMAVVVHGRRVGTVYQVDVARAAEVAALDRWRAWIATGAVVAVALAGLGALLVIWLRIVRPFQQMRRFAAQIAAGDLAAPLAMDKTNAFGAFTESFDLMRTELAAARRREAQVKESKKALVAQLSHDIRTPVASIAAVAELLDVSETDAGRRARLATIRHKAGEVADLLADLFRANHQELEALPVAVTEHPAADLTRLIHDADVAGVVVLDPPPECLLRFDGLRMRQVLDNVISNSAKYAGTPIQVSWHLDQDALRLRVADRGPGVPTADLPVILGRGVRGSRVGDIPGQGIGLYTTAWLMERMGGSVQVSNGDPGFVVDLMIGLA